MKTKNIFLITVAIVLCLVATGCKKEKGKEILLDNSWVVRSIKVDANSAWQEPLTYGSNPILSFLDLVDFDKYVLELESSLVMGVVKVRNNKIIIQSEAGSTELAFDDFHIPGMPIDSDFSKSFANLFVYKITHYETDGFNLTLIGKNGATIRLMRKVDFIDF